MKPCLITLLSLFYIGCECCRPDIKLGDKFLDSVTCSYLPASADTVWKYINQRQDTLKLKCAYSRNTSYFIAVDFPCTKGFDSQIKYWNYEYISYDYQRDSFTYHSSVSARTDRLTVDTMLLDFLSVSLNGLYMSKITSMRDMDTIGLDPEDYRWLSYMNDASETEYIILNGKTFRNVLYAIAVDTMYLQDSLSCRELYYAKGIGLVGFKLKNGDLWVLD